VLEDVNDFWTWTRESLPQEVAKMYPGIKLDLSRIAVAGESAGKLTMNWSYDMKKEIILIKNEIGGYMAIQSTIICSNNNIDIDIKLVISQYGSIDLKIPHFLGSAQGVVYGAPSFQSENLDKAIQGYLASIIPGAVRTSEIPGTGPGTSLLHAMLQQRHLLEFLGPESALYPMEQLEGVKKFPPVWMIHGRDDNVV
jgi:hypothetical protein